MSPPPARPDWKDRLLAVYLRRGWRGFLTLQRWLRRPAITARTRYGAVLALHPEDYIDRIVLKEGGYESEVMEALRPFFAPGAVLWDIGANIGLHSVSAARLAPGMPIHSFEPNPSVHARLRAHVDLNHAGITCWPVALGDRDGTATLHINASGNPGMTTLTPWAEAAYDSQVEVRLARADTLVAGGEAPAPTLIKLDVEGGEAAVLAGMGRLLADPGLRAVVFETRADLLDDPARCPAARLLQTAGFTFAPLQRKEASGHNLGNFLATRPTL
jgi:FkbM family methyltransferase